MSGYFILAILTLAFVVTFQIAKASEYVSVLKGEEKSFKQNNRINAFLFIAFLVLGLAAAWWCNEVFYKKTLMAQPAASDQWREGGFHVDDHFRCNRYRVLYHPDFIVLVCI